MNSAALVASEGPLVVHYNESANADSPIFFSLVVPTYNEVDNVRPLIEGISKALDEKYQGRYEVIIVDDNSPDGTTDRALETAKEFPQLKVICRKTEKGLASAVIRGWQKGQGKVVGVIDGDLQHPASTLVGLLGKIEEGADIALASRYIAEGSCGDWGIARRATSSGASLLGTLLLPEAIGNVKDPMSGYFVVRKQILNDVTFNPKGYKILLEVLARGRAKKVVEVPFEFGLRQHGQTKVTWRHFCEYVQHLLELRVFLWQKGRQ